MKTKILQSYALKQARWLGTYIIAMLEKGTESTCEQFNLWRQQFSKLAR